ncbi:MAG: BatA and WFA domain-containing protein [Verrucomicrobia bacterium]|nr:BatA and WFA domain-containing protein [Verrucomicrobiota bacterium]
MFPFGLPWGLLALAGVPALAAIYWLRNRFRRRTVSSLILWVDQKQAREGGTRMRRIQLPLLFFLELAAIVLLAIAAGRPLMHVRSTARPLVVVLDDSYSMLAGGADSPRARAIAAIRKEVRRTPYYSVRFILAGQTPQNLGEAVRSSGDMTAILKDWTCHAPGDCIDAAVTLASEVGGERARILIVTDRPFAAEPGERVQWWAFGEARPNVAFVNAVRSRIEQRERVLLEIANLSPGSVETTLTLEGAPGSGQPSQSRLALAPGETRRLVLEFDANDAPLRASLNGDALAIDNSIVLVPETTRPVRVQLNIGDAALSDLVEKALEATGLVRFVSGGVDLLVTDGAGPLSRGEAMWTVRLIAEEEAESYLGPFVLDRTHPLTEGLSLEGIVWGAGKSEELAGLPVISAGNTPLVSDTEDLASRHDVRIRLRPDLSTLTESVNWPILLWNLVEWRAAGQPGLRRPNLRLGMRAGLRIDANVEAAQVTAPDGTAREWPVHGKMLTVEATATGLYSVVAGDERYPFAANALHKEESDLMAADSGEWGQWATAGTMRWEYRSIAWVFLLLALGALVTHTVMATRRS